MKINSRVIALTAAWVLTIAIGFLAGRKSSPAPATTTGTRPPARPTVGPGSGPGADSLVSPAERAAAARQERPGSGDRPAIIGGDVAGALRDLLTNPDRIARARALLDMVDRLEPEEFRGVVEALRNDPLAEVRRTEYYLLVNAWVGADPYAATDYLLESDADGYVRESALAAWAAKDPQAAAEWASDKKDGGSVNNWTVGLIRGVASTDPDAALALLGDVPAGRTRSEALKDMLPYVTQNGFDFTTSWIASIDDDGILKESSRRVARSLTKMDAAGAGEWVRTMDNVSARRDASEEVSDQWARHDLEAARQWAEQLPENTRTEAAEGVARHMARQDPERAADWLQSLGDNPDLDGARHAFLDVVEHSHPQIALETAVALHQEPDRMKWMGRILGNWQKRDRQTTRTWVETNAAALPERIVKHFLK